MLFGMREISASLAFVCCGFSGCGTGADILPGRVAIEVTVKIDSQLTGDGNLVLRPQPGVKCPLIKVPVVAGVGRLNATAGPVPGGYQATFLPAGATGNITDELSNAGRVPPTSVGPTIKASPATAVDAVVPKGAISVTVPAGSPATFVAEFEAA
jgi:hypothetical protein